MPRPKRAAEATQEASPQKRAQRSTIKEAQDRLTEPVSPPRGKSGLKPEEAKASAPKGGKKQDQKKATDLEQANGADAQSTEDSERASQDTVPKRKGKYAEVMPLQARTTGLRMFVGAHVSGAGGTNTLHGLW